MYVFRCSISPRYHKALIDDLTQFFRLFKPTICDNENVWRQENLALLVHWDMWIRRIKNRISADRLARGKSRIAEPFINE